MRHFTIVELDQATSDDQLSQEAPMVGTIRNVSNDIYGNESFLNRFHEAVGNHFDAADFSHDIIPDLFAGSPWEDVGIEIDGSNYMVRIIETQIY